VVTASAICWWISGGSTCFVLLVGAGLDAADFCETWQVNPGLFDATRVLTFRVSVASVKYHTDGASAVQFFRKRQRKSSQVAGCRKRPESFPILAVRRPLRTGTASIGRRALSKHEQNTTMADCRSSLPGYFKSMASLSFPARISDDHDVAETHLAVIGRPPWRKKPGPGRSRRKLINIGTADFAPRTPRKSSAS